MSEIKKSESIEGVVVVKLQTHSDERGFFAETWRHEWVPDSRVMLQSNRADRTAGTLVGLHYHLNQADYWYVSSGQAQMVLHDLRIGSSSKGTTQTYELGKREPETHRAIYIPPGVAHGFAALTDMTITYLVDSYYNPEDELGVAWNDPEIKADWGINDPVLSKRDQLNPLMANIEKHLLPHLEIGS